jgi:hypothetical protein
VQKLNDRTYNTGDAKKVEHMLEPMNKADEGHDKMGPMYHFYGALAATYINGVVGQALVEGEKYTHGWRGVRHMPSKEAANTAGERAGLQLTTTGHKFRDGLSNALKAELTMLTPILVW